MLTNLPISTFRFNFTLEDSKSKESLINANKWFSKEQADLDNDQERSVKLAQELEDLEERATELDRRRSHTINSIRSVATI